jgi:hypothetical protein
MCNFSVNIDFLNSLPPLVRSFSINIDFSDMRQAPLCNFSINSEILIFRFAPWILYSEAVCNLSVNIEFLDIALKTGVQFFNLYRISGFAPELFTKIKTWHYVEGALSFEKAPCYYAINMCVCVKRRLSFSKS